MSAPTDFRTVTGKNAVDNNGEKVGKVGQIYLDDSTEQPVWVTVSTGLFGTKESFAPLYGATVTSDDKLQLAVTQQQVKDAPNLESDGHLGDDENAALYQHYSGHLGESAAAGRQDTAATNGTATNGSVTDGVVGNGNTGHDTSGPNTDEAMTRSEERLRVGTENVETGRATLRKYIVEENVSQTVPVRHEEVRVVREPITERNADAALSGADLTEEEHEVTLHAERVVTAKETVPVERVALATETVTGEERVDETLRKEQIDESGVTETRDPRRTS